MLHLLYVYILVANFTCRKQFSSFLFQYNIIYINLSWRIPSGHVVRFLKLTLTFGNTAVEKGERIFSQIK